MFVIAFITWFRIYKTKICRQPKSEFPYISVSISSFTPHWAYNYFVTFSGIL